MSKIEEMAAEYSSKIYKEIQGDVPYSNLSDYKRGMLDCIDPYVEDAYIACANAVLSEIENTYNKGGTIAVIWLVRELKGKE